MTGFRAKSNLLSREEEERRRRKRSGARNERPERERERERKRERGTKMKYLRLQKFSVRSRGSATAAATATRTRHACLSSLVVARKNGSALAPTHVCHARAEFEDTEKSQQQESSMNQDNSMVSLFFSSFLFYKVKVTDGKTKKNWCFFCSFCGVPFSFKER